MSSTNLLGLTQPELADFAESIGESRYRGRQLFLWLYSKRVTSIDRMTDLGKGFRQELHRTAVIDGLSLVAEHRSESDATVKFLFALGDGARIESVLIPPSSAFVGDEAAREEEQKRLTLCVSTQVGCPLGCTFCATATMGYVRNLSVAEIIDQILLAQRMSRRKITNIVFMGMGEPLMNYDHLFKAIEIITQGIGIAARRITVSTAGWADRIRQMGDERRRVKLAVSLHSADNDTRTRLMPITRKFDLDALMASLAHYYRKTRQRVTFEYIFFDGVNDSDRDVARLIKLARRVPCKINVIPFHSIDFAAQGMTAAPALKPSPRSGEIVGKLRASHLSVFVRSNAGEDITAACGQLAVRLGNSRGRAARGATVTGMPAVPVPAPMTSAPTSTRDH